MAVFSLFQVQNIPGAPDKIWSFFADPGNLPFITPPDMSFKVLHRGASFSTAVIYPGQIIEYRLRPLAGIPVYWMTDLVHYSLPFGFIGNWVNALLVSRRLKMIFDYRREQIEKRFGAF